MSNAPPLPPPPLPTFSHPLLPTFSHHRHHLPSLPKLSTSCSGAYQWSWTSYFTIGLSARCHPLPDCAQQPHREHAPMATTTTGTTKAPIATALSVDLLFYHLSPCGHACCHQNQPRRRSSALLELSSFVARDTSTIDWCKTPMVHHAQLRAEDNGCHGLPNISVNQAAGPPWTGL